MLASVHRAAVVLPYCADFSRPACLSLPPAGLISAYLNIDNTESLQHCVFSLCNSSFSSFLSLFSSFLTYASEASDWYCRLSSSSVTFSSHLFECRDHFISVRKADHLTQLNKTSKQIKTRSVCGAKPEGADCNCTIGGSWTCWWQHVLQCSFSSLLLPPHCIHSAPHTQVRVSFVQQSCFCTCWLSRMVKGCPNGFTSGLSLRLVCF